jgi:hypothetical protein
MESAPDTRKLGKTATFGGLVAGLLLLPLPVFAYSIADWTITGHGVNAISPNADNKTLEYFIPGSGFGSNASNFATSTITQTAASPETANVFANLSGLKITSGDLKITVTVGSTTVTTVLSGALTDNIPLGSFLVSGSQTVSINFQFENATFTDTSTVNTIVFR